MAAVRGAPARWKIETVEEIKNLISKKPVLAVVSFRGVPANQMQNIRRNIRNEGTLKVVKNNLLKRALEELGGKYAELSRYLNDQIAIIVADTNPFKLYKKIEETKEPASLKPNQVSPVDVVLNAGPTSIPPGPGMGDLQLAGIPVAIEKGKVVIRETKTIVKAGEVVKPEIAKALEKLGIKPIKLGLEVKAIYDSGVILTPAELAIDPSKVMADLQEAYMRALNLAINAAYVTEETAEILIMKAFMDAKNLAINACIFEPAVMPEIIAKAYSQMLALASKLPQEALDEDLKGRIAGLASTLVVEVKETEAKEEKKEEKKKEEEEKKEEEAIEGLGALFG